MSLETAFSRFNRARRVPCRAMTIGHGTQAFQQLNQVAAGALAATQLNGQCHASYTSKPSRIREVAAFSTCP